MYNTQMKGSPTHKQTQCNRLLRTVYHQTFIAITTHQQGNTPVLSVSDITSIWNPGQTYYKHFFSFFFICEIFFSTKQAKIVHSIKLFTYIISADVDFKTPNQTILSTNKLIK